MATLKCDNQEIEVSNGANLQKPGEELGIPFGCTTGICGTCIVEVKEGMENLSERTQEEKDMLLEENERLLCQCKIKNGLVQIKF